MLKTMERKTTAKSEILLITPEIAKAWLDKNKDNRAIKKRFIDKFASDMKSGNWSLTYDPVRFDENANLIDGQHRLMACVQSERAFESLVVYNLGKHCRNIIDTGAPRTARDVLAMQGMANTSHTATAIRILLSEAKGQSTGSIGISHSELLAALDRHPSLPLWVPSANRSYPRGLSLGAIGYISYAGAVLLSKKGRVTDMLSVLQSGVPDYEGDPIHKLRERILRGSEDGSLRSDKRNGWWTFKHCWNLFRRKAPMERLVLLKEDTPIEGLDIERL